jgi:hypothetical protein
LGVCFFFAPETKDVALSLDDDAAVPAATNAPFYKAAAL